MLGTDRNCRVDKAPIALETFSLHRTWIWVNERIAVTTTDPFPGTDFRAIWAKRHLSLNEAQPSAIGPRPPRCLSYATTILPYHREYISKFETTLVAVVAPSLRKVSQQ